MKICRLAIILIAAGGLACNIGNQPAAPGSGTAKTESRSLAGFKKIRAENAINLDITVQKEYKVSVQADDNLLPSVTTEVTGDTLVISLKDKVATKTKINVTISMPELTDLDLTGATTCTATEVKTDKLEVDATGASKIKLAGEVNTLKAKAVGASGIDAETLRAAKVEAESDGASSVSVSASNELKADASGASSITYIGDPPELKQNVSDVSTIKKK